jgi:pilus assembly protein TadC
MAKTIPFLPISYKTARALARPFGAWLKAALALMPSLEDDLERIDAEVDGKSYLAGALLSSAIFFIIFNLLFAILISAARLQVPMDLAARVTVATGAAFSLIVLAFALLYPHWKAQQRLAALERDLLFAIRHLTIQTNAGVPLFQAMGSVAEETGPLGYGEVSREFAKIIKEVKGGKELSQALDDSAARNPSRYYERIMWQLANSNRAGVPVNEALKVLLNYLSDEQRIALRNYGAQLSPLALMYMLTTIVGPTLALIFMMIAATIIALPVSGLLFGTILVLLVVIQVAFLGLIRSRRPKIIL